MSKVLLGDVVPFDGIYSVDITVIKTKLDYILLELLPFIMRCT